MFYRGAKYKHKEVTKIQYSYLGLSKELKIEM
jgi:hypothetical protein